MNKYTFPFFLSGIGSALEVYPLPITFQHTQYSQDTTDAQRLASDWYRVGWAIYSAIESPNLESLIGQCREIIQI